MTSDELIEVARFAREGAYAPYSCFSVGAALLCASGKIYRGCNVENISYGLTNCAERVCVGSAIAAGDKMFIEIVIVADTSVPIVPCGACRQVLAEFNPDLKITSATLAGEVRVETLAQLFPLPKVGILDRPA